MASRIFRKMMGLNHGEVRVSGSFRPNGSSAVSAANNKGNGWSVARTSEGLYTLTFADKYQHMIGFKAFPRKADTTAMLVQAGDYSASDKTVQIRTLVAGGGSALVKTMPLDILGARPVGITKTMSLDSGMFTLGSTPPTLNATAGGWAFDADAETMYIRFRAPDDWDGASDLALKALWHPLSGDAVALNETVVFKYIWRATPANTTAVDHDTAITGTTTWTETSDPGTDKGLYRSAIAIDYDGTDQVINKGDWVTGAFTVDATNSTYVAGGGDVVVLGFELEYTRSFSPLGVLGSLEDGPYIERVNGATDPTFRVVWPAGDVTPLQLPPILWPTNLDGTAGATVRLRAAMSSTNDTPTIAVGAYEGVGDTNFGGATGALSDTVASVTRALAHGDISDTPGGRAVNLLLTPGAHNTDAVHLYGAQLDYTSTDSPDAFALADLSSDVDNVINFEAIFGNMAFV